MKLLLNTEFNLYEKDGHAFCDSLMIAETFEKQHAHVLRDIENALKIFSKINQSKFGEINFIKADYKDSKNRKQPMYLLTKDGFSYLTMGYEGEKAAKFKVAYINRFNQMEQFIKSLLTARMEYPAFTDAVKQAHEIPKPYHFSNENNMIYRIVLGVDAKKFREQNGIKEGEVIRPYLATEQIQAIEALQRIDVGLNIAMMEYEARKQLLSDYYKKMQLKAIA